VVTGTACENTSENRNRILLGSLNRVLCLQDGILTLLAELVVLGDGVGSTTDLERASLLSVLEHQIHRGLTLSSVSVVLVDHARIVGRTIHECLVGSVVPLKPVICSLHAVKGDFISTLVATEFRDELDGLHALGELLLERDSTRWRAHGVAGERSKLTTSLDEVLKFASNDRIRVKELEGGNAGDLLNVTSSFLHDLNAGSISLEVKDYILTMVDDIESKLFSVEVILVESLVDELLLHRIVGHTDDERHDLTVDLEGFLELQIKDVSVDETTSDDSIHDGVSASDFNLLHGSCDNVTVVDGGSKSVIRVTRGISVSVAEARLEGTKFPRTRDGGNGNVTIETSNVELHVHIKRSTVVFVHNV